MNANPMLGTPAPGLILANRGDVVFGMARDHAGFAARAFVEVDHHAPLMRHWLVNLP